MRTGSFIAAGIVAAGLLAGCSSASEKAAEKLIEAGAGGDVNVDLGGDGGMSFDSEDGSFSIDADGNVKIDSEDGSFSMDSQSGKLADGFPDVPLPDGDLVNSARQSSDGETSYTATFQVDGDGSDAFEDLSAAYASAGYEIGDDSVTQSGTSFMANASFRSSEHNVVITVFGEEGDGAMVSVMVLPADA